MNIAWNHRETWLYKTNPSAKLIVSGALFIIVLFTHHIDVLMHMAWILFIVLFTAGGHPVKRTALLSLPFVLMFVSSAMSMILFGKGDTVWFRWGLIIISEESFYRGLHIGFKAVDMAMLGLLMALTTKPVNLIYSLMQQLKLPPRYAYSFMAAIRLLPMAVSELKTLEMAHKVRGVKLRRGLKGVYDRIRLYSVPLLAQSIRRAQRVAVAMEAKRFSSAGQRTYYYQIGWSVNDLYLLIGAVILWAVSVWLAYGYPFFGILDVRV